jgi:predicted Rdx family selenoprotein
VGEVALQPTTGGIFIVEIFYSEPSPETTGSSDPADTKIRPTILQRVLWDRKINGGFPETKELKRRVRDVIEPGRNLGHVDRDYPKPQQQQPSEVAAETQGGPNTSERSAMPEAEQQQQHQQKQPPGPRWESLGSRTSQSASSDQQNETNPQAQLSIGTDTELSSQSTMPKDLRPPPRQGKKNAADGPVYDPQMPAGGIKPVAPPVALSSRYVIQELQSQPQKSTEECEDCR